MPHAIQNPCQFLTHMILMDPSGTRQWTTRSSLNKLCSVLVNSLWFHESVGYFCLGMRDAGQVCYLVEKGGTSNPKDNGYGYTKYYFNTSGHVFDAKIVSMLAAIGIVYVPETTQNYDRLYTDAVFKWSTIDQYLQPRDTSHLWLYVPYSPVEGTQA